MTRRPRRLPPGHVLAFYAAAAAMFVVVWVAVALVVRWLLP